MKKRVLIVSLLGAGMLSATPTASAVTPYVRASGGVGLMNNVEYRFTAQDKVETDKMHTGAAVEGAFGIKTGRFRVEAAAGYQSNQVDQFTLKGTGYGVNNGLTSTPESGDEKWTYSIQSYMVNGFADFNADSKISPFVMAGIGMANIQNKEKYPADATGVTVTGTSNGVFAWQAGAGVGVKASDNITIDLEYRYFAASNAEGFAADRVVDISTSNILLGVRYGF
ncbi:MAG: porin family protein [Chlorobiaceae bacterium]|nr:porin family protein [Chlorobiaceae bacterium]